MVIGVALGSGGAKGFAHVGVLKALEEHGIPIHVVAGTSMGSLVGAFYATGMKPPFMERLACTLRWRHWADLTVPRVGLMTGEKVHQLVALLTRNLTIPEADIPLGIVATDLLTKRAVTFRTGRIADAVRASISIPGVFVPFVTSDGVFVDGGVVQPLPVRAAREMGAERVIGVDLSLQNPAVPETMFDVIMQSLDVMVDHVFKTKADEPDVRLKPDLSGVATSHFHKAAEAIAAGYACAVDAMDEIKKIVSLERRESI